MMTALVDNGLLGSRFVHVHSICSHLFRGWFVLWHLMRGREKYRLCPAWSTSDRMWLKFKLMCMVKTNLDSVTIADSSNMRDFGLLTIKHMLLSHNTDNKAKK